MKLLRLLLLPVVPIYCTVTKYRNMFYDFGVFASQSYDFPIICVGNLSTGGTGKTPMVEYLVRLLKDNRKLATLSRGYKRTTDGFVQAEESSNAKTLGDEPFQFYSKFKDDIVVAVDEQRREGIKKLIKHNPDLELILLDDAYQHRAVKAGFNILLTSYDNLYVNDMCLPTGNLREPISGADRANIIIVTKCPTDITKDEMSKIRVLLQTKMNQPIFFSFINYSDSVYSIDVSKPLEKLLDTKFSLVTGIANSEPLVKHLKSKSLEFEHLEYKDHHNFTEKDIEDMEGKLILTTEKDYMRLKPKMKDSSKLFYLPIEMEFIEESDVFDSEIRKFINSYN